MSIRYTRICALYLVTLLSVSPTLVAMQHKKRTIKKNKKKQISRNKTKAKQNSEISILEKESSCHKKQRCLSISNVFLAILTSLYEGNKDYIEARDSVKVSKCNVL